MWGESKSGYLVDVTGRERQYVADFVTVTRSPGQRTLFADLERIRRLLSGAGLEFPLIAKPDVGRHGGTRIDDVPALREYLRHFPAGEKLVLQRCVPYGGEAAALYARLPGTQSGRLLSLSFRADGHWRDACCRHSLRGGRCYTGRVPCVPRRASRGTPSAESRRRAETR